jgi:predicted porin
MTSANASATSSGTSADDSANTLYLRNMCAYVGTDTVGLIRIGQGSCVDAASAVLTGLNDEFDYGGWDGGVTITPGAVTPAWPWPDSGSDYMPQGMAYLSPVIAGFDGVVSFSPNNSTIITNTSCSSAFEGCANQEASNAPGDYARWMNRFEVSLRYRNAFGPVGFAVAGTYTHSGVVEPGGAPPTLAGTNDNVRYNPLNYGTIGAEVAISRWFAVGANTMFGAFNGPGVLQAKPYAAQTSTTTAIAWEAGAKYTIPSIPLTIGGSYYNFKYQGQPGLPTQRVSQGVDVGAVYGLGPGMVVFLEGLWGSVRQGGFNFLSGSCSVGAVCGSTTGANLNNNVQVRIAMTGLALQF